MSRLGRLRVDQHLIGPNWPRDVLDLLVAEVGKADLEPVADLVAHCRRDADSPWLGDGLESRRHINAVAENVAVFFDDHVAEIEADAKEECARRRHVPVAPGHPLLKIDGAGQGLCDALELDEHAIAGGFYNAPPALGDRG